MTTSQSPLCELQAQADQIASRLKRSYHNKDFVGKAEIKFAVVMDDKIISITMATSLIGEIDVSALSAYVLKQMQDKRDN